MTKPRLLDLFCGAGGCTKGYQRAGFYVIGVDINPQPNYCGDEFVQYDALDYVRWLCDGWRSAYIRISDLAAIHVSPPCQAYTSLRSLHKKREYPDLIAPTRELLVAAGIPYVIENVENARRHLIDPVLICGSMFDPPMDVQRHRYFEANWPLAHPQWPCRHKLWDYRYRSLDQRKKRGSRVVQVHGGGQHGRDYLLSRVVGVHGHVNYEGEGELRKRAMGIDWMTQAELAEAIPPAYTELIGHQLMQHVERVAA
jgi:DNA (cytosine-5)-methyltransferase 1